MDTSRAKGRKDDGWQPVGLGSPWWRPFLGPGQRRRPMQPGSGFMGSMSQWQEDERVLRRLSRRITVVGWLMTVIAIGVAAGYVIVEGWQEPLQPPSPPQPRLELRHQHLDPPSTPAQDSGGRAHIGQMASQWTVEGRQARPLAEPSGLWCGSSRWISKGGWGSTIQCHNIGPPHPRGAPPRRDPWPVGPPDKPLPLYTSLSMCRVCVSAHKV